MSTTTGYVLIAFAVITALIIWQFIISTQSIGTFGVVTVTYKDGTTQAFYPNGMHVPSIPITIIDTSNKIVTSLQVELYATVAYSGEPQSWSVAGTGYWSILDANKAVLYATTMPINASGASAPLNNVAFVIASSTVSANSLEAMYTGWVNGATYYFRFGSNSAFTINFADGSQTKTASSPNLDWQFSYYASGVFMSLSFSWNPVPTY